MKTKTISVTAGMAIMVTGLLIYAVGFAASQDNDTWFTQDAVDTANGILGSGLAQFLSGTGWTALERQSGRSVSIKAGVPGSPIRSLPFQSGRFEVMVNDPARDILAASDISTQSETAVAAFGDNVVVAFNDSTGFVTSRSGMGWSHSSDGGASFTDLGALPVNPATQTNLGDPGIVVNRGGVFYASYLLFDAARPSGFRNTVGVSKSTDGGFTWSSPVGLPAFGIANNFLDKSFIATDATGGASDGHLYVTFTNFSPGSAGTLPIMFSRSTDGGLTFSAPIQLSLAMTQNQGSEPVVGPKGEIYVAWFQFTGPQGSGIVEAKSTDGGLTFGAPVFVASATAIGFNSGSLLGNFRVNSFPRIDVDPSTGNVYITYASGLGNGDSGDVFFVRSTNGGATWSAPVRVNDEPGNNDQFFPDLAVNSAGVIRVFWYDKRRDPNNIAMTVYSALSNDGGLSFGPNIAVTPGTFPPAVGYDPVINRIYMGDYIDIKAGMSAAGRTSSFFLAWGDCRRFLTTLRGTRPDQDVFFTRK